MDTSSTSQIQSAKHDHPECPHCIGLGESNAQLLEALEKSLHTHQSSAVLAGRRGNAVDYEADRKLIEERSDAAITLIIAAIEAAKETG